MYKLEVFDVEYVTIRDKNVAVQAGEYALASALVEGQIATNLVKVRNHFSSDIKDEDPLGAYNALEYAKGLRDNEEFKPFLEIHKEFIGCIEGNAEFQQQPEEYYKELNIIEDKLKELMSSI